VVPFLLRGVQEMISANSSKLPSLDLKETKKSDNRPERQVNVSGQHSVKKYGRNERAGVRSLAVSRRTPVP
jgi:hypothetical protein